MAEWTKATVLKTVVADKVTEGSNPSPSATYPRERVLPVRLQLDLLVVFEGYAGGAEHWSKCQVARKRSLRADILRT